jgi:hypothetical protein
MTDLPKIVLDEDVLHTVLAMKAAERRNVLRLFQMLQREWWKEDADYLIRDAAGRFLKVKAARPFMITYWHDGPVDELRIVDLKRIRS